MGRAVGHQITQVRTRLCFKAVLLQRITHCVKPVISVIQGAQHLKVSRNHFYSSASVAARVCWSSQQSFSSMLANCFSRKPKLNYFVTCIFSHLTYQGSSPTSSCMYQHLGTRSHREYSVNHEMSSDTLNHGCCCLFISDV